MPKPQLLEDTLEMGVLDLFDPEIEYDPGSESEEATVEDSRRRPALAKLIARAAPRLMLIVNEAPSQGSYEDHSGDGVDLTVYSRDPDEAMLAGTLDQTLDAPLDRPEDLSLPTMPPPGKPRSLQEHRQAVAGAPQDELQRYFLASLDPAECQAAPELAAVILKARHDLHLLEPESMDEAAVESFREACLLGLLRGAPEGGTPDLRSAWRAALKNLGELYD